MSDLAPAQRQFVARVHAKNGEAIELSNEEATNQVTAELQTQSFRIDQVKRGQRRRKPQAPFITSTLQQEASRRLGFNTRKTMRIAQQLYEGIDLGKGETVGLITYMRTDSTNISNQAQAEAKKLIVTQYGEEYLPEEAPKHKTSSKRAQEAHEAIRPSDLWRLPDEVKAYLSRDQYRLYQLIWLRFIASQMAVAVYETIRATIQAGPYELRASGSRLKFQGFLLVYEETKDEDAAADDKSDTLLPELSEGELLDLQKVISEQHFTQPPPRYTEASLVKTLEEFGIGRPSTYAPIISTIQERGYVERADKRLYPTELGKIINDLLVKYFPDIVNVEFTANLEENLDQIAWNDQPWVPILQEFYAPFEQAVQQAEEQMPTVEVAETIGEQCELCSHDLIVKYGRFGKFIACSNFPDCRYTRPFVKTIGVKCPKDGAELVERKTKKGRVFYGCSNYPDCDWTSWKQPLPIPCPNCEGLLVVQNKRSAQCTVCEERFDLDELMAAAEKEAESAQDKLPEAV
jgi:DNA topoisomerase-1